jgi:hypothetical protein
MSNGHVVFRGLHAIMSHQCLISRRPIFSLCLACVFNGSAQVVGAMLLWHTTDLPQRFFDPLS